jgi:hypothetical protein
MSEHAKHRFSITFHTDDLAVVGCLRALAKFCQKTGNNNIPWGGTKDQNWQRAGHNVTFRFSSAEYRDLLRAEADRLLPSSLWKIVGKSDSDPAKPQRVLGGSGRIVPGGESADRVRNELQQCRRLR